MPPCPIVRRIIKRFSKSVRGSKRPVCVFFGPCCRLMTTLRPSQKRCEYQYSILFICDTTYCKLTLGRSFTYAWYNRCTRMRCFPLCFCLSTYLDVMWGLFLKQPSLAFSLQMLIIKIRYTRSAYTTVARMVCLFDNFFYHSG